MKKRAIIWSLTVISLIGAAFGIEKYYDRITVYECTNRLTGLPVFIKVQTHGALDLITEGNSWVEADYHHPDGEVYVYSGLDPDYFDHDVYAEWRYRWFDNRAGGIVPVRSIILLDLLTSRYTITDEINGGKQTTAAGACVGR